MTNKKRVAFVFIFLSSTLFLLYLRLVSDEKNASFYASTTINQFSDIQSKKSYFDPTNLWSKWIKSKNSEISYENLSKSEKEDSGITRFPTLSQMFFEPKCLLTVIGKNLSTKGFEKKQDLDFLKTEEGKKYKKILAYHHAYSRSFYFGLGHEPFEAACCKEKRCFMTNVRNVIPIEEFDAVMIHFRDFKKENLPKKRKRHQRWIFYEREPPPQSSKRPQDFHSVFNWTMTYRKDSDIVSGYGEIYNKRDLPIEYLYHLNKSSISLDYVMKTKNKMIAWMVSNCKTLSQREYYFAELNKIIPVDIYGKCGPLKCSTKEREKCYKNIEKHYKFYLSFENNFCKDYVSEKLFSILKYYVIPVVRGSGDYRAIAPPHSYINVEDFRTPKDLANYLIYLDQNDTAYMEYFRWKKDYFVSSMMGWLSHANSFCALCQKLHSDNEEKVYYNITQWFLEEAQCNKGLRSKKSNNFHSLYSNKFIKIN